MALRIAAEHRIPVLNLAVISPLEALTDTQAIYASHLPRGND